MLDSDIIIFDKVNKLYNNVQVLDNVSFSLKRGKITALIGPNGAGKSTIAKLILKIIKPTGGNIIYANNIKFGYVPQKIDVALNMPISVKGFIELMTNESKNSEKYHEVMNFANVAELIDRQMSNLSGGQFQRVLLAANLLNRPNFIILDEPTQGLDLDTTNEFYAMLEKVSNDLDITIFIISHDLHAVIKKADKVLCLNQHLCCFGEPDEQRDNIHNSISFYKHKHDHIHYL
jgi:zinc transport system ATP-binding protein